MSSLSALREPATWQQSPDTGPYLSLVLSGSVGTSESRSVDTELTSPSLASVSPISVGGD